MLIFNKDFFRYFSLLGYLGFLMVGNIGVFIFIYKVIEKYFQYKNTILFILFVIFGVFSGFYNIFKIIMKK